MKKWMGIMALLVLFADPSLAMDRTQADTLVAQASRVYATGDHANALSLYDSVRTTFTSAALLFNIGNCHFKLNDIPHAILFYERALRLAPGDEDVLANLELARQNVVDRVNELPSFTLGSTWGELRGGRDTDQWARRAVWLCLLFFLLLSVAVSVRPRMLRRTLYATSALFFVATLLSISFAFLRHQEVTDDAAAIIMTAKVDVRSEPRANTTVLFVLHKGTKVEVLQEENGWNEVRLANGNVGWMPPGSLERI
jgi:hypothetical protein